MEVKAGIVRDFGELKHRGSYGLNDFKFLVGGN
jgi:hypothetical protein